MAARLRGLVLCLLVLLFIPATAAAQTAARTTVTPPSLDNFPNAETYLDVRDAQGRFVHGLAVEDIRLLEDELPVQLLEASDVRPGVQVVVAIDPGQSFGVRDSQGVSRYDALRRSLDRWARQRWGSTVDDWSLLVTNGPAINHTSDPLEWAATLSQTLDLRAPQPSLDTLSRALDIAADPTPRPGMKQVLLFITSPPDPKNATSLDSLAGRAQQQGVPINVWMITSPGAFSGQSADLLAQLAKKNGGQFFTFTGEGSLPNPEDYLAPLRSLYRLVYRSRVNTSGAHQLLAEVQTPEGVSASPPQSFTVDIQPPNPVFVSPPLEIIRLPGTQPSADGGELATGQVYSPTVQDLQLVIDFPDQRVRPLLKTTLYVNGLAVLENNAPPFDRFSWDISSYITTSAYLLRAEAGDIFGLTGSSVETQVQITILEPAKSPLPGIRNRLPVLAGLTVLLTGIILLTVLVLGGRIRPRMPGVNTRTRRKMDPVTQPVPVKAEPAAKSKPGWSNRLQWPQRRVEDKALALLNHITENNQPAAAPIPITSDEVTIGSDPRQSSLVVDDPSVDPLHARLTHTPEGVFRLADEGSIAGTWINYTPVSRGGAPLEHGDLIHVGRAGFRFTLRQPTKVRKPVITLDNSKEKQG